MEDLLDGSRREWAQGDSQRLQELLTSVASRSSVAGAVAGAAETVPRLPAPAAVLAVVGHTPAEVGGVKILTNLRGDACWVIKQRSRQTDHSWKCCHAATG